MDDIRFQLLGPMGILVDGVPAKLPGVAERALLVQLVLAPGRTIPATLLVDRLWSEATLPVDPMNALQIRVSKLAGHSGGWASTSWSCVTVWVTERASTPPKLTPWTLPTGSGRREQTRLTLPPLAGTSTAICRPTTKRWVYGEGNRSATSRQSAGRSPRPPDWWNCDSPLSLSAPRWPWRSEWTLRWSATSRRSCLRIPTLESLAGLLMLALYRSGRQADALDVYTRTRAVLDETLGLEPSVSLRSLHERVLRQDESLGGGSDLAAASAVAAVRSRGVGGRGNATNLPTVVRPLIGRDEQLDSLASMLDSVRLLSLIGPGGAGKTSLALATAVRAAHAYPDGAFGVRLASVGNGEQVPLAVADALGVPLDGSGAERDVRQRLTAFLARRQMLLLVDNCEHVVDAAASLIDDILGQCPTVTVIATSREALAVPDEVQVMVAPLATPPEDTSPGSVLEYPAAQLFAERARAVRPGLVFDSDDLSAVGQISRELDGIPLALELAAARVASMSPGEIADRLAQRFSFLTSGARTAEARQQTLRATVEWSYALLSDVERRCSTGCRSSGEAGR